MASGYECASEGCDNVILHYEWIINCYLLKAKIPLRYTDSVVSSPCVAHVNQHHLWIISRFELHALCCCTLHVQFSSFWLKIYDWMGFAIPQANAFQISWALLNATPSPYIFYAMWCAACVCFGVPCVPCVVETEPTALHKMRNLLCGRARQNFLRIQPKRSR